MLQAIMTVLKPSTKPSVESETCRQNALNKRRPHMVHAGKWIPAYFRSTCHSEMSRYEMMNKYGVCPYCGNVNPGGTIIEGYVRAKRFVKNGPWWKLGNWEYK